MKLLATMLVMAMAGSGTSESQEVLRKLETTRLTVNFNEVSLEDAISCLREASGVNFVIDPRATAAEPPSISLKLKNLSLKSVLTLMLRGGELTAVYRSGAIVILPKEDLVEKQVTRIYDVRDLLVKIRDFPGPKIDLDPRHSGINRDMIFNVDPLESSLVTEDQIVDLITEFCGNWDDGGEIRLVNGLLVATHTARTHQKVGTFMMQLRRYR